MRLLHRTARWLVTGGLIVNLGLTGMFPHLMAGGGKRAQASGQITKCCCGTKDSRCCGMGCCTAREAPATDASPFPNSKDQRGGQNNPLAAALAKAVCGDGGKKSGFRFGHAETAANRWLAQTSLQAKQVRIDA